MSDIEEDIRAAEAAIIFAKQVREFHARKTERGSKQRQADLEIAQKRLRETMAPLRSAICRFKFEEETEEAVCEHLWIRDVSLAIQKERRKIWKMLPTKPKKAKELIQI